jgi:RNA polymerase sigma-70 factor (ECF subfamily)
VSEEIDRALVARVASGDRPALEELYHRHAGWLTARLEHRCRDRETVDIALQDTFVAVWRGAGRYGGQGAVGAWLWGIAVRRLADELRRRRPVPVPEGEWLDGVSSSSEELVLEAGGHGDLADAFRELDADLQRVLLATVVDGLSTKEAARLLGIPQGTVKTRMMRAREHLRGRLEELQP